MQYCNTVLPVPIIAKKMFWDVELYLCFLQSVTIECIATSLNKTSLFYMDIWYNYLSHVRKCRFTKQTMYVINNNKHLTNTHRALREYAIVELFVLLYQNNGRLIAIHSITNAL